MCKKSNTVVVEKCDFCNESFQQKKKIFRKRNTLFTCPDCMSKPDDDAGVENFLSSKKKLMKKYDDPTLVGGFSARDEF